MGRGRPKQNNGVCKLCGKPVAPTPNKQSNGVPYIYTRSVCRSCGDILYRLRQKDDGAFQCERCGWLGYCDKHHKDGNHSNEKPANIEYLCPNCHRTQHSPLRQELMVPTEISQ